MGLIKSRPKISVRIPREITPGKSFIANLVLRAEKQVPLEFIDVRLVGREQWSVGSGNNRTVRRREILRLGARLREEHEMQEGEAVLPCRFDLPAGIPHSYKSRAARVEYELSVHVSVPWWPDAHALFEIHVRPEEQDLPKAQPIIYRSHPGGPEGKEPYVEVGLASNQVRPGGVVAGAFALGNSSYHSFSQMRVGLVGMETLYYGNGRQRSNYESRRYEIQVGVAQASDGEAVHFRFRLPKDIPPSYGSQLWALSWYFESKLEIHWSSNQSLRVPITVLPREERRGDPPMLLAPPPVGSDRLRPIWEQEGARYGLTYANQALTGSVGSVGIGIARSHKGRSGITLLAELGYPSLQMGLTIERASGMRKMIGGGVLVGDKNWDVEYYVLARDASQATDFLRPLLRPLSPLRLTRMDDEHLYVEQPGNGERPGELRRLMEGVIQLARSLELARQKIPPPTQLKSALPAWEQIALRMNGELETARMWIKGTYRGMGAEVRTDYNDDGQAIRTWLHLEPPTPIDAEYAYAWDGRPGVRDSRFTGDSKELLEAIQEPGGSLDIGSEWVSLGLPYALDGDREGEGVADQAMRRFDLLARLISTLRNDLGPYR